MPDDFSELDAARGVLTGFVISTFFWVVVIVAISSLGAL